MWQKMSWCFQGSCHIGGNVSTNAGGLRLLRFDKKCHLLTAASYMKNQSWIVCPSIKKIMQVWKPSWIGSWGWSSACIRRGRRLPFQVLTFCISLLLLVFSSLTYFLTISIAWRRTTLGMTWNTSSSVPRAPSASSPESPYLAPPDPGEYGQLQKSRHKTFDHNQVGQL